jgi:TPR repeat protein
MTALDYRHDAGDPLWKALAAASERSNYILMLQALEALALKGEFSVFAQIGEIYERGATGIPRSAHKAIAAYRRGILELDDPACHIGLGRCLFIGNGVVRDLDLARTHFEIANDKQCPLARLYLGRFYYFGLGVERDLARAEGFLAPLLELEYVSAYVMLSKIAAEKKSLLKSVGLRIHAIFLAQKIRKENPTDTRLL